MGWAYSIPFVRLRRAMCAVCSFSEGSRREIGTRSFLRVGAPFGDVSVLFNSEGPWHAMILLRKWFLVIVASGVCVCILFVL